MAVTRVIDQFGFPHLTVENQKNNTVYTIEKCPNGFTQYQFQVSRGKLGEALQGTFTTPDKALEALARYLRSRPKSLTKRRDDNWKENHEPKSSTDSKGDVQQRSSD